MDLKKKDDAFFFCLWIMTIDKSKYYPYNGFRSKSSCVGIP